MNAITQHYVIDLSSNNNFVQVPAVQGDGNETRYVEIELIENGVQYVVDPAACEVTIAGTKPDGKEIWNSCTITNEGYILVEITYQMTAVPGRGSYQIIIFSKSKNDQIKSFPFFILVTAATYDPGYIISDDEFEALAQYTQAAKEAADKAEEAVEKVDEAVEKVDEAVDEVKEIAQDIEDKYDDIVQARDTAVAAASSASTSATNAAASETAASGSATAAAASATNAAASESTASTAATNAAASETAAKTSETNAKASETAAATSESNAATSATNAAASKTAAKGSAEDSEAWAVGKRNGTDVESTDPAYHNNSKYYATQAGTSATNAATSESNASTSASSAGTSATNASNSATLSQSWAVGGTGTRTGENTNNAKYWCEQAQAVVGLDVFTGATPTTSGTQGLVPGPGAGDQEDVLFGDATWKKINITFIGTTAQWNTLTAAEKAFYQVVLINDD